MQGTRTMSCLAGSQGRQFGTEETWRTSEIWEHDTHNGCFDRFKRMLGYGVGVQKGGGLGTGGNWVWTWAIIMTAVVSTKAHMITVV